MIHRGHTAPRPTPGRFRCLVCQAYVLGTDAGHCPTCGFVPPVAPPVAEAPRTNVSGAVVLGVLVAIGLLMAVLR